MKKLDQKGVGLIEVLLVVVAITLVIGVGFYVVNANKDKEEAKIPQTTNHTTETKPVENKKQYLEIKELGVKFELNDKIKNAYYEKIGNYYYFSVRDFDSNPKLSSCGASKTKDTLGILSLVTGRPGEDNGSPAGGTWTVAELEQNGLKKVGDTYYGFMAGNASCFDPTLPGAQELVNVISGYKKAFTDQIPTFTIL